MGFDAGRYWEERLARLTNLEGVGCEGRSITWNRMLYRTKIRALQRVLKRLKLTISGTRALDIGCGVGFWIDTFQHMGAAELTGLDIAPSAVKHCEARFRAWPNVTFQEGDIGSTEFMTDAMAESFQLVSSFDVFYHITDDEHFQAAVANVARAMAPGGTFLVSDIFGKETYRPQEHVAFRSREVYREALAANGLTIEHIEPVTVFLNSPIDARGLYGFLMNLLYYKITNKMTRRPGTDGFIQRLWLGLLYHLETPLSSMMPGLGQTNRLLVARKPE